MPPPIQFSGASIDLSPRLRQSAAIVGSPALAAETIVCQTPAFSDTASLSGVLLVGSVAFTVGTSGTAFTLRIRQTGLAGTVVYSSGAVTGGVAATNLLAPAASGFDTAPAANGQVYVLTLQVTAGAAASTVSATNLVALLV